MTKKNNTEDVVNFIKSSLAEENIEISLHSCTKKDIYHSWITCCSGSLMVRELIFNIEKTVREMVKQAAAWGVEGKINVIDCSECEKRCIAWPTYSIEDLEIPGFFILNDRFLGYRSLGIKIWMGDDRG